MAASRDSDWRNTDQLVNEINRLVEAESTGTLFVRTVDDHLGCVVFASGEIVSVMFRGVRGIQGIEYVRAFDQSTFHFDENALLWEDPGDLPDTREILKRLNDQSHDPSGFQDGGPLRPLPAADRSAVGTAAPPVERKPLADRAPPGYRTQTSGERNPFARRTPASAPGPQPARNTLGDGHLFRERSAPGRGGRSDPSPLSQRRSRPAPARQAPIALSASELKRTVCDAAVTIMGPMGRIVCDEAFGRAGIIGGLDDLERLLRQVASEIEDEREARDFREGVLAKATPREGATTAPRAGVTKDTPEYNKLREVIESEAIEFLGPLATLLCDEYFQKYSAGNKVVDIGAVINSLVDEIGDLQRADQFRERIARRLG